MKQLSAISMLLIFLIAIASCKKDPPGNNKQQRIQAAVDKVRKALADSLGVVVPTLNVLIQTPNEKIFVSSVDASQQPVTAHTYFRFASNTKNVTATAILNMWEDGWLDYKAKITDRIPSSKADAYVPATADWDFPYKAEITIEQLMQHSAGVFDVDNDPVPGYNDMSYTEYILDTDPAHQFNTTEMVKVLKEKNLSYFSPGTGYHYSNTGFSILAEIIKRVYSYRAGKAKTYADYLEDYIVDGYAPVHLPTLHFPVLATDNTLPNPRLTSTELNEDGIVKYDAYNMSAQVGEGNGYGTMEDLNKHIRTLMKGQNALQPATVQVMQKSVSDANPRYALGCDFTQNLGYGHNGARIGYLTAMFYDPVYDVSVVSMINLADFRHGFNSFIKCFNAVQDGAYVARQVLGYPGRP